MILVTTFSFAPLVCAGSDVSFHHTSTINIIMKYRLFRIITINVKRTFIVARSVKQEVVPSWRHSVCWQSTAVGSRNTPL